MIIEKALRRFCLAVLLAWGCAVQGQMLENDFMFVVELRVSQPEDFAICYTTKFDHRRIRIDYNFEDPINYLSDYIYEEEPLPGPDCFVPEFKLIYRDYTYVVSLYCSRSIKYLNKGPFEPSSERVKSDLIFTYSVQELLTDIRDTHFGGESPNLAMLRQVETSDPLIDPDTAFYDDPLFDEFGDEDEFFDMDIDDSLDDDEFGDFIEEDPAWEEMEIDTLDYNPYRP